MIINMVNVKYCMEFLKEKKQTKYSSQTVLNELKH